ncbi:MAG: glycoside hydrolase family 65 protein [Acidimicrobiales bacterium]|nr:glycoside hydrolase family 65 protein [Acidimicrobiales bacterium]
MSEPPWWGHDPWSIRTDERELDRLGATESILALANGHIGLRGTLDEGEPRHDPGTYLNGFFEERPLPHAEVAYGYPESGQTVVNVTDGKLIRAIIGDAPLDLRHGRVLEHERALDLRRGALRRRTVWRSPGGATVELRSERFVSLTRRTVAAIHYELTPLDRDVYVALQSDLLANEPVLSGPSAGIDPRDGAALGPVLRSELAVHRDRRAVLVHRTAASGQRVAAGMDHVVDLPDAADCSIEAGDDLARFTVAARLPTGTSLRLVKFLAYGWSSRRSAPALRDQVEGALATAALAGYDELAAEQAAFLARFWARADVELEGDLQLQQAVRFGLFHVLQAGARNEQRPIPAKGLTGPGYDGHAFWDTETYVLPVLTYTAPEAARDALRWRHSTLEQARRRAIELGQRGAAFPWRTIDGRECSGYWPAGTASFHVGADIADAVARHVAATGDDEFDAGCGTELLVETARLWASLGHHDGRTFRIDGVTGPDEYTAVVDDNIYTNLMAQRNLREAVAACARRPATAERLGVDTAELTAWGAAADAMAMPYDSQLGVHPQSEGFTQHAEWDFEGTPASHYPLLLHAPYFEIYRKQVVKQADLVLALYLRGDAFTPDAKARNFVYYEARTVRDSSLSACPQAIIAAEVGHLELARDYWAETALTDLSDVHGNAAGGVHLAALAGGWLVAVAGFGGMRDHGGRLTFAPRLAPGLSRLRFHLTHRSRLLRVTIEARWATYELLDGDELVCAHHGEPITVTGEPARWPIPAAPVPPPVRQPAGRAPRRHRPAG